MCLIGGLMQACREDDSVDPIIVKQLENPTILAWQTITITGYIPPPTPITDSVYYFDYNPNLLLIKNDSIILNLDRNFNSKLILYYRTQENFYNNRTYTQTTIGIKSLDTSRVKVSIGRQES
jgi:hypothetical protein